jgi:hypothetical protein
MADEKQVLGIEDLTKSLLDIAVESWRFGRLFDRLLSKLDAGEQGRYRGQFRWFQRKLEEALTSAGLRLVNVEGHPFDPGMAATSLNIGEFDSRDVLIVDQMLEPIIMGPEGIVRTGTVTLRKVES